MKMLISDNPIKPQVYVPIIAIILTVITLFIIYGQKNISTKPTPENYLPSAEVISVKADNLSIPLQARGIVEPEKQISLVSQVIGTVTHISEHFATGASFNKGDILLQADTGYLNMELQKAKAAYAQAVFHELEVKAQIESGNLADDTKNLSDLAQGKPQLAVATSAKDAALAAMQVAQKQMDNATLRAPFNGKVMMRNIQEQEPLVIGRPLAQIYSTDTYLIRFPLTQEQFSLIDVPSSKKTSANGSSILISNETTQQQWRGKVIRTDGFISPNRMIYVIAELHNGKNSLDEIIPGSLLKIEMQSKLMNHVTAIPARALHENNTVWIINNSNHTQSRTVNIIYRGANLAYVSDGLQDGEQILVNQITGIADNMPVTVKKPASPKTDIRKDTP